MKLSIRAKLIGCAALILIGLAIVGWRGVVGMRDINAQLNEIRSDQFEPARLIANANIGLISWNRATLNHVLAEDAPKMDEYEQIMLAQKIVLLERLQQLSKMEQLSERGKALVSILLDGFANADPIRDRVVALSRSGDQEEARKLISTDLRPIIDEADAAMTMFLKLQERQLDDVLNTTDKRYSLGFSRIIFIIGIVIITSLLIFFFLSAMITKGVNELVRGAQQAMAGDLTQAKVSITSKDEFGFLGTTFNRMLDNLAESINQRKLAQNDLKTNVRELEVALAALRDAQDQLVRKEKLAALGQLASSISHELRNPLGVISNSVYYLGMKLKDADEKVAKHVVILQTEVQRADLLIADLLDFTRTPSPSFVNASITEVVEDALAGTEIPEGVAVVTDYEVGLPHIIIDPALIRRVCLNMLSNAVQAMPEGGRLGIKTGVRDGFVEIIFRDTGKGIEKEYRTKIFEPLFSTRARGVGLGLAIVAAIVEKHKGRVEVESEIGRGTAFTVKLPLQGKEVA